MDNSGSNEFSQLNEKYQKDQRDQRILTERKANNPHFIKQEELKSGIKAKVCPSCHSYFINEKECETCGLRFDLDRLGDFFGDRSFYSLKQNFLNSLPWPWKIFKLNVNSRFINLDEYIVSLLGRLRILIDYNLNSKDSNTVLKLEQSQILDELVYLRVEESRITKSFYGLSLDTKLIEEILNEFHAIKVNKLSKMEIKKIDYWRFIVAALFMLFITKILSVVSSIL